MSDTYSVSQDQRPGPANQLQDTDDFGRYPFIFVLEQQFKTHQEVIDYMINSEDSIWQQQSTINKHSFSFAKLQNSLTPKIATRINESSTELGRNDAINCLYQYGWDDDIVHPVTAVNVEPGEEPNPKYGGLGRVYSEKHNTHQQLLHLTPGIPKFSNLIDFYSGAFDQGLAKYMNTGSSSLGGIVGTLIGSGIRLAISVPFIPFSIMSWVGNFIEDVHITKYCDFKSTLTLYYRFVNSILITLATNMNLFPPAPGGINDNDASTDGTQANALYKNLYCFGDPQDPESNMGDMSEEDLIENLPSIFQGKFDMFTILAKRDYNFSPSDAKNNKEAYTSDQELVANKIPGNYSNNPKDPRALPLTETLMSTIISKINLPILDMWGAFTARSYATYTGADKFISFRLDKSTDASESVGNSSGESAIQQALNSKVADARSSNISMMDGSVGIPGLDGVLKGFGDFISGITSSLGIASSVKSVLTGDGFVDIPELWLSSSFSKSYSFHFTFRSPYGDPLSIFTSVYVPLVMLMAMALPRSIGLNSYTSPFYLRAYCKGMFAIPFGLIESMSIRRGKSEFGWSNNFLPTVVEVDLNIKDLSPVMHMAMLDSTFSITGLKNSIFGTNSTFQEYLMTLSGLGLSERLIWSRQLARQWAAMWHIKRGTLFNPNYWGQVIGNSGIGRFLSAFTPYTNYKHN